MSAQCSLAGGYVESVLLAAPSHKVAVQQRTYVYLKPLLRHL